VVPATAAILASDVVAGRLVILDFDAPVLRGSAAIQRLRERTPSPAAQALAQLLRDADAQASRDETAAPLPAGRAVRPRRERSRR
jgi:hypothetical protein